MKQWHFYLLHILFWISLTVFPFSTGRCPPAVFPFCRCRGAGQSARRPGQSHPATVGRRRRPELLHTRPRVSAQRLRSLVSSCNCSLKGEQIFEAQNNLSFVNTLIAHPNKLLLILLFRRHPAVKAILDKAVAILKLQPFKTSHCLHKTARF